MLSLKRALCAATLAIGCGTAAPASPVAVPVPSVSGSLPDEETPPVRRAPIVELGFPLVEFLKDVDEGEDSWSKLTVYVKAVRQTTDTRDRIELELRGDDARVMSKSVGENASSARLQIGSSKPFQELLRACAAGIAAGCPEPTLSELEEPWGEFELTVGFSHPDRGDFAAGTDLGLRFAPLIEKLFRAPAE